MYVYNPSKTLFRRVPPSILSHITAAITPYYHCGSSYHVRCFFFFFIQTKPVRRSDRFKKAACIVRRFVLRTFFVGRVTVKTRVFVVYEVVLLFHFVFGRRATRRRCLYTTPLLLPDVRGGGEKN